MVEKNKTSSDELVFSRIVRVSKLSNTSLNDFDESPDFDELGEIARLIDALSVKKMRFTCDISPLGKNGWQLDAKLGATVTQPCVITAESVRTRIDIIIQRQFIAQGDENGNNTDFDASIDDEFEPLGHEIDLGVIATEALSLAIPEYPRIDGASHGEATYTAPENQPIKEEKVKPFAGLAALKEKLTDNQ